MTDYQGQSIFEHEIFSVSESIGEFTMFARDQKTLDALTADQKDELEAQALDFLAQVDALKRARELHRENL